MSVMSEYYVCPGRWGGQYVISTSEAEQADNETQAKLPEEDGDAGEAVQIG